MGTEDAAVDPLQPVVLAGDLLGEAREVAGAALDITSEHPEEDPVMHYRTLYVAQHLGTFARGRRGDVRRDLDPPTAAVVGEVAKLVLDHAKLLDPVIVRKAQRVRATTCGAP